MGNRVLFVSGIVAIFFFVGLLGFFWLRISPAQQFVEKTIPLPLTAETETGWSADRATPSAIFFVGDIMFDRYIRTQSEKFGKESIFEGVRSKLLAGDGVVANLEGPITSNASKSVGSAPGESRNYIFTFDPMWAKTLFDANIRIVNIGNNHILNFGESGLVETRRFLRDAGVKFFGDPLDETLRTYVADIRGKKLGFVNYNQFSSDAEHRALIDIERLRSNVDALFVYTHWGVEYAPATSEEKRLAHLFIDRGADAVIGSHPHVVQEHELYRGKAIYYSLGNFVFDQYFSSETTHSLMVEALIAPDNTISFQEISLKLSLDGKTSIVQ
ncbi:MAG: CapA family protein [Candidatus Moraniibacteriota bacterium]